MGLSKDLNTLVSHSMVLSKVYGRITGRRISVVHVPLSSDQLAEMYASLGTAGPVVEVLPEKDPVMYHYIYIYKMIRRRQGTSSQPMIIEAS